MYNVLAIARRVVTINLVGIVEFLACEGNQSITREEEPRACSQSCGN